MNKYAYEKLRYGFFTHYVAPHAIYADGRKVQTIDETADGFDVRRFADDIEAMKAEYLIFTAWHFCVRPLYPSKVIEKWRPGNCSKRDLVGEIIDAVRAKNIKVILYTHPRDGHDFDEEDRIRTGWGKGYLKDNPDTPDPETFEYEKWNKYMLEMYTELFDRYGSRIDGVYTDGMGPGRFAGGWQGSLSYEFPIVDYFQIRKLAKESNPDMAIIQNYFGHLFTDDFAMPEGFLGYENENKDVSKWPACVKALAFTPFSGWSASSPKGVDVRKISSEDAAKFTIFQATCNTSGGTCWASGPYCGGGWEDGVMETMTGIGAVIERIGESLKDIVPSTSWPTISGDTLTSKKYTVCCSSSDQRYEYIHILKMPEDKIIHFAPPEDHAILSDPAVIGSDARIKCFSQDENGVKICLDGQCDEVDTVVRLERINAEDQPVIEWINDTDNRILYCGKWYSRFCCADDKTGGSQAYTYGSYEYDIHETFDDGDWLFISIADADQINVYGNVGPDGGKADVLIDNIKIGGVDSYSLERGTRILLFTTPKIYGGTHALKIIKTGGRSVKFDALKIIHS